MLPNSLGMEDMGAVAETPDSPTPSKERWVTVTMKKGRQSIHRIMLMLMIMASMLAHVVDVKGAFLHGEFEDREIIHMKVLQGFEKHFPEGSVLLLLKCLYGLKQPAKAFWRQLLCAASAMGLKQSMADPCLYCT